LYWNLALDANGDILVAAETAVYRVSPTTGKTTLVSSGGYFSIVLNVAASKSGAVFVTNVKFDPQAGWVGQIIRVNPHNGRQTLIAEGGFLHFLRGLVVHGDDIYVTGMATGDQNFGAGRVTHIDSRTGQQRLVSECDYLVCPAGIDVEEDGRIVVADPYTINLNSRDLYDGALNRIDPITGAQSLITRGHSSVLNHVGLAVVPDYQPRNANSSIK
jgi:hypothetical protein